MGAGGGGAAGSEVAAVVALPDRLVRASETSVLVARAQFGHGCRVPVEEHVIFIAPPRSGKTGTAADVIAHHPGAVVATTTRGICMS